MSAVLAPKIATLARLAAAGLPVPEYVALAGADEPDPATWPALDALLRGGPVIVRAALFAEDTAETSGAGLGTSVAGCRDRADLRAALRRISDALAEPWLRAYLGEQPRTQVLVQREICGPWLAVVAVGVVSHVELHRRGHSEPLAAGLTPELAGPLVLFPDPPRAAIARLCDAIRPALPEATHGLDLELVADHDEQLWVVQARPLTRPLHPGWPAFAAAARLDLEPTRDVAPTSATALPLPGLWTLDAEHNPAALSLAHAGLIRRLTAADPVSRMHVLAGWLYNRGRLARDGSPPELATLRAALTALQDRHIPAARARLVDLDRALALADRTALAPLVDHACELLREVLTHYAALPARPDRLAERPGHPLSLHGRDEHLDVLPATWDIASPTLLDLSPGTSVSPADPAPPLDDPAVLATLLGELDDHLFALGLAPLRRVYLRAAALLAVSHDDIFLLTPDELHAALLHVLPDLAGRRRRHDEQRALFPPPQLLDGLPVPAPAGSYLRGAPIGATVTGPLHPRHDLAALLASPPPPGAILAMPALTAQAAVVLRALGVRAVCCEHGGALSHAALMARELGLSALIGCRGCMDIPAGTHVRLDTRSGHLRVRGA